MSHRRTPHTIAKRRSQKDLFILAVFLFLSAAGALYWHQQYLHAAKPLLALAVPKTARTYLPDALELPQLNLSVLGAQTIDPKEFVNDINAERQKTGTKPLRMHPLLMKAAQLRADVILKYQNFSHLDPYEHIELASVLPKVGYNFVYASENIGMGGVSAPDFVNGFMQSTAHRENLLSPTLADTGVAFVTGPYKQYYVNIAVQLFAIPGGKDETLGYTAKDIKTYQEQLEQLDAKLNPVTLFIDRILNNKSYTAEQLTTLSRKKEILTQVYNRMKKEEALTNDQVALILEYNNLNL